MRIELPHPTWADAAQRAHDDAHTLTLPAHVLPLLEPWFQAVHPLQSFRVEVPSQAPLDLTLTL